MSCSSVRGVGASGSGSEGVTTLMADFFARGTIAAPRETGDPRVDRRADPARSARGAVVARTAIATVRTCEDVRAHPSHAECAGDFAIRAEKQRLWAINRLQRVCSMCDRTASGAPYASWTFRTSKPSAVSRFWRDGPPRRQTRQAAHHAFGGEPILASIHSRHALGSPARRYQSPCVRASSLTTRTRAAARPASIEIRACQPSRVEQAEARDVVHRRTRVRAGGAGVLESREDRREAAGDPLGVLRSSSGLVTLRVHLRRRAARKDVTEAKKIGGVPAPNPHADGRAAVSFTRRGVALNAVITCS